MYIYNLLWNIPTNLQARYDLFCVKSAVKPRPTNLSFVQRTFTVQLPTDGRAICRIGMCVQRKYF